MQALHSSSAHGCNMFHYWGESISPQLSVHVDYRRAALRDSRSRGASRSLSSSARHHVTSSSIKVLLGRRTWRVHVANTRGPANSEISSSDTSRSSRWRSTNACPRRKAAENCSAGAYAVRISLSPSATPCPSPVSGTVRNVPSRDDSESSRFQRFCRNVSYLRASYCALVSAAATKTATSLWRAAD